MKKIFISAMLLTAGLFASAQVVSVKNCTKVNLPQGTVAETPVISPDGSKVAFQHGSTLKCVDIATGKVVKLTDNGQAYELTFTEDGSQVVFRQRTIDKNGLSYTAVKSVSTNGGKENVVVKPTRNLEGVAVAGTTVTAIEGRKARSKNLGAAKVAARPVASIEKGHLNITVNGKTTTIDPQGRGSYLWPQVSPDGKKVVYWLAYRGCFVSNIDGSNPVSLGELRAARWMGDNTVIGMLDRDNGQEVTSSKLIAKTLDGKSQTVTPETMIALYPTADSDGDKVAFVTEKGELYVLDLVK